jgi:hypothetical protein
MPDAQYKVFPIRTVHYLSLRSYRLLNAPKIRRRYLETVPTETQLSQTLHAIIAGHDGRLHDFVQIALYISGVRFLSVRRRFASKNRRTAILAMCVRKHATQHVIVQGTVQRNPSHCRICQFLQPLTVFAHYWLIKVRKNDKLCRCTAVNINQNV